MKLAIQLYTLRDIIRDEETLADALAESVRTA